MSGETFELLAGRALEELMRWGYVFMPAATVLVLPGAAFAAFVAMGLVARRTLGRHRAGGAHATATPSVALSRPRVVEHAHELAASTGRGSPAPTGARGA